ncbi:MAG: AMP-binding protein, partial [Eudoraea sp.]|nr:AMP-binding protein [Eudoraea sp.]
MLLHHNFIDVAKVKGEKLAIHDFTTNRKVSYSRALLASILLGGVIRKMDKGFIGVMLPTSAGCILTKIGALMAGRIPVMINYSTGAEQNAKYAQRKCDFRTIITSRALLEKIECPFVEGMIYIEDIMEKISGLQKVKAALISKLPGGIIKKLVHGGKEEDTCVILFTSGSEKDPKAVQLTHKNITANIISASKRFNFTGNDTFL